MSTERRIPLFDFPGYCATENGDIVNTRTGRVLRQSPNRDGYMQVCLTTNGSCHTKTVHSLVANAFCERPSQRAYQVNHINGNKRDNRSCNLEYVTPSENMYHAYANGLNHWVGYNERPVRIVETGEVFKSQAECARSIGGSQPNINACLVGRRRSHMGYHYEYAD